MGLWNYDRKGKHDHEAGSSSGGRRGSVKEEAASPPCRASSAAPFTIGPRPAGQRDRQYLSAEVCRRYWETRTPVPWSDIHLPNAWHLFADQVPIPPVLTSGRARHDEIERCRRLLPVDLYYDDRYARTPPSGTRGSGTSTTCGAPPTSPARPRGRDGHGRCAGVHGCAASRPRRRLPCLCHHLHFLAWRRKRPGSCSMSWRTP
ncbi:hypothetical protein ZWY2020_058572 [Hordeum vulgare]|nr:hypothetical protein ZWY2020_058572 [Hordeum vulgare]